MRPTPPGVYWFKGSLTGKLKNREVILATVVEVEMVGERFVVFFPRGDVPVPIIEWDGQWSEPLEVPP